jgi:NAD+ kinase
MDKTKTVNKPFKRVGIYAYFKSQPIVQTLKKVFQFIQSKSIAYVLETNTAKHLDQTSHVQENQLADYCDLLLVIGGDGSVLAAAQSASPQQLPIIGIHQGRLGFLADINPNQMDQLSKIMQGHYQLEKRMQLSITCDPKDSKAYQALNECVISSHQSHKLIDFDVLMDDKPLSHFRANGLIVCTPTGSTAYALSAGGPIVSPNIPVMTIVPICSHTLNARPLVVSDDHTITVKLAKRSLPHAQMILDGQPIDHLHLSQVSIQVSKQTVDLVHPENFCFYQVLKTKLNWQT